MYSMEDDVFKTHAGVFPSDNFMVIVTSSSLGAVVGVIIIVLILILSLVIVKRSKGCAY